MRTGDHQASRSMEAPSFGWTELGTKPSPQGGPRVHDMMAWRHGSADDEGLGQRLEKLRRAIISTRATTRNSDPGALFQPSISVLLESSSRVRCSPADKGGAVVRDQVDVSSCSPSPSVPSPSMCHDQPQHGFSPWSVSSNNINFQLRPCSHTHKDSAG